MVEFLVWVNLIGLVIFTFIFGAAITSLKRVTVHLFMMHAHPEIYKEVREQVRKDLKTTEQAGRG